MHFIVCKLYLNEFEMSKKEEKTCYLEKTLEETALLKNLFKEVISGGGGAEVEQGLLVHTMCTIKC